MQSDAERNFEIQDLHSGHIYSTLKMKGEIPAFSKKITVLLTCYYGRQYDRIRDEWQNFGKIRVPSMFLVL